MAGEMEADRIFQSPSVSTRTADNHQLPRQSLRAGARGSFHGRHSRSRALPRPCPPPGVPCVRCLTRRYRWPRIGLNGRIGPVRNEEQLRERK